jgi:hypothetical protein
MNEFLWYSFGLIIGLGSWAYIDYMTFGESYFMFPLVLIVAQIFVLFLVSISVKQIKKEIKEE